QKKLSTPPFARTSLFQPERFHEFEETFRATVAQRLERVRSLISESGGPLEVQLEIEIKAIMLEMLVNNFFGASVAYEDIRERYVPALDRVIDHIVLDTVINKFGFPLHRLPSVVPFVEKARRAQEEFEHLTEIVLSVRQEEKGLWGQFKSDASDEALKSNIRVFLAGALEATTSYASWAIAHLARNAEAQDRCYEDVRSIHTYTPDALANAGYLGHVLNETLRLTPSLYFHPRRATRETTITTSSGETLTVPEGTHILLDVWHANRHEDHWGVSLTGYPASAFAPERWETISKSERASRDMLHFGFGHGPRFCPGKNLGQLEVALVVGACVKLFRFEAVGGALRAKAGVSTKPEDGTLVRLSLRSSEDVPGSLRHDPPLGTPPPDQQSGCPYSHS
ncbi:MAG: cytochrome P450, partial [Planctomycetota bacterium]